MKRFACFALAVLSAFVSGSALATPVATARTYGLNGNQPYFEDASVSALLPAADNLLSGLAPVAVEGAIRSGYGNGGVYWEVQANSPSCLTDGAIPTHEDTGNWNKESNARWLVSDDSTLTWTFAEPQDLGNVRLWTQWPDGYRTDIAVSAIQVTTDGSTWTTLANSSFCSGKNTGDAAVQNTIQPFLDGMPHFRVVTYADEYGHALATGITGLRIVFPDQELGYTCFWEIEAERGVSGDDLTFEVMNTVNDGTDYTGIGEVAVKRMPFADGYEEYQFTVGAAEPAADGWQTYTAGDTPADVIAFALPQTLDAEITVHCRLRGDGLADLDLTDTIKSAYGAQPTASVSGGLSVLMANTYDGAPVTAAQILALNTSSDSHGGIVSVTAQNAVVRGNTNLVLTVTNLAGNSASCNVPVTATLAGGALPQGYLSTLLHLGTVFQTDDLLGSSGGAHDYLSAFGGERNVLPHAGVAYTGLTTSGDASTPGTLVWTVLSAANGHWEPSNRDNYVKYWHVYVVSPDDRDVSWRCKNDDDIYVWVNGEQQAYYGYNGGGATSQGHLKAGVNSVMIKLYENGGGDFMEVALRQPDGVNYFDDLEYRLDPGFLVADATTGSREALSSGQARILSLPRVGGFTKYQVFQDDADGTVQPGATWTAYDPDDLPATTVAYTAPAHLGDTVYFAVVLSDDSGQTTRRETCRIATLNAFGSLSVKPFDTSAAVSGSATLAGSSGTAVLRYGTNASSLDGSATFPVAADGSFSGSVSNLLAGTTYFYEVEIDEGGAATGFGSGSFQTLAYETFGNCAVVNGLAASDGNYAVISFSESGRIRFPKAVTLDVLVVGGGGGGGNGGYAGGGGGGAGGVVYRQEVALPAGEYDVTVGAGGAENEKGADSVFAGYRAYGGGAGNHGFGDPNTTDDGGSGGGASAVSDWAREAGTGTEGQGHDGGLNLHSAVLADETVETKVVRNYSGQPVNGGGGGGGAGAPGGSGSFVVNEYKDDNGVYTAFCNDYYPGAGGDGVACSITGEEVWYGGGGGGGAGGWYRYDYVAAGGTGGGGTGGAYQDWKYDGNPEHGSVRHATAGVDGTGGGGGGGGSNGDPGYASNGGRGGNGIVIIRFAQKFADDSNLATGGNTVAKKNGYMIHSFTESGTFELPNSTYADILLVGGGGGGGNGYGAAGGGGGGGMLVLTHQTLLAGRHTVTVGAGGLGGIRNREDGEDGGDSAFNGHTAFGGGGGAGIWNVHGRNGGSGGGAYSMALMNNRGSYTGGTGVEGQGHNGGGSVLNNDNSDNFGAGGGGAGEAGYSSTVSAPGKGGDGLMCDITGEEVWYAGGGAGGGNGNVGWNVAAEGGKGGGGASGHWPNGVTTDYNSDNEAFIGHGTPGTGGGGGGGAMWGNGNNQGPGGNGGSGIVIIRYKLRPSATILFIR